MAVTPNLSLPLVNQGQAYPHIPINEALRMIDTASTGWGGGGSVASVVAGTGIDVDNTDPANPIVSVNLEYLQDSVGAMLTDSSTIDFTYDDATGTLTAIVKDASITIAKVDSGVSGDWWGKVPVVQTDGVMEIGKYIDFHIADAGVSDFDVRLTGGSNLLESSGHLYAPSYRFDSVGNASVTDNTGTYGTFEAVGKKNGYAGVYFSSGYNDPALMFGDATNECGFWDSTYGWRFWCDGASITLVNNTVGVARAEWGTRARMSRGTAAPGGGADGDLYFRYTTDPTLYANVSGTWEPIAGVLAVGGGFGRYATSDLAKTSDTTLAADTALDLTLEANTKYRIEYSVYIDSAAAPDLKFDFTFSGTTTSVFLQQIHHVWATASLGAGVNGTSGAAHATTSLANVRTFTISANDTVGLNVVVTIEVGASGGTFSFRWAQNTSSATAVTRRRNSAVQAIKLT